MTEKQRMFLQFRLNGIGKKHKEVLKQRFDMDGKRDCTFIDLDNFLKEKSNVSDGIELIDMVLKGTPEKFKELLEAKGY